MDDEEITRLRAEMDEVGETLAVRRRDQADAMARCRELAVRANAARVPVTEIAQRLRVARNPTVLGWLGKLPPSRVASATSNVYGGTTERGDGPLT